MRLDAAGDLDVSHCQRSKVSGRYKPVVLRLVLGSSPHSVVGLRWRKVVLQEKAKADQMNAD
jgi:hypothetical protein